MLRPLTAASTTAAAPEPLRWPRRRTGNGLVLEPLALVMWGVGVGGVAATAADAGAPGGGGGGGGGLFPGPAGLSVSHDSVFTAEAGGGGGGGCSEAGSGGLDGAPGVVPALSVHQLGPGVRAELLDAVRRRGRRQPGAGGGRRGSVSDDERGGGGGGDADDDPDDDDVDDDEDEEEEDLGLPRSPCNSPTTADVLLEKGIKELPTQSHSTCSDGSLLSMGSSEMDEDSLGQHSGHSSKLSLHDKKMVQDPDPEPDLELRISGAPLSHSAARHKMAVRPRRTHGAPRRTQRLHQLPATPEVLEEGIGRASSPEVKNQSGNQSQTSSQRTTVTTASESPARSASALGLHAPLATSTPTAGATPTVASTTGATGGPRVTRSRSNAAARQREPTPALTPPPPPAADGHPDEPPPRESFFSRILRSSGRRKKERDEGAEGGSATAAVPPAAVPPKRIDERGRYAQDAATPAPAPAPIAAAAFGPRPLYRSTAAARQRVEPINLPPSPEASRLTQAPPPPRPAWPEPPVPAPRRTLLAGSPPKNEDSDRGCLSLFASNTRSETDSASTRTPVKKAHSFRAELSSGIRGLSLRSDGGTGQPESVEKTVPPPGVVPATRHFAKHTHVSSTRLGDDGGGSRPRRLKHKSASLDSISSGGGGSGGSAGSGSLDSPGPALKSASIDSVDCVAATAVGSEGAVTVRVRSVSEHKSEPELPTASPTSVSAPVTVRTYAPLSLPVSADDSPASVTVAVAATASVTVPVPASVMTPAVRPVFVSEPVAEPEEIKPDPKPELIIETKREVTPEPEIEPTVEVTPEPLPVQEGSVSPPTTPTTGRDRTPSPEVSTPTASPEPVASDVHPSESIVDVSETPSESSVPPAPLVNSNPSRVPHRREARPTPAPEPTVPEFFRVRLNRVDSRPAVNVVLSTGAGGGLPRGRLRSADDAVSGTDATTIAGADTEPERSRRITLATVRPTPPPSLATLTSLSVAVGDTNGDAHSPDEAPGKVTVKEETAASTRRPEDAAVLVKVLRKGEDERPGSTKEVLSFRKNEDTFTKLLNSRRKDSDENGVTVELSPAASPKRVDDIPVFVKAIRKKEEEPSKVEKEESPPVVSLRKAEDVFGKILRKKDEEEPKEVSAIVVAEATAPPPRKVESDTSSNRASSILARKKEDDTPPTSPVSTQERPKGSEDSSVFLPSRVLRRREDDLHHSEQQSQAAPPGRRLRLKSSEDEIAASTAGKRPDVVADAQPLRKKSGVGIVDADGPLRAKTDIVENGVALRKKSQPQLQTSIQQEDTPIGSSTPEVVLRRKSTAREVGPKREEEPELLKVFARRSLKLKDPETEMLPLSTPTTNPPTTNGTSANTRPPGRDSDKENEGGDSPREERRGKVSTTSATSVLSSAPSVVSAPVSTMGSRLSTVSGVRGGGGGGGVSVSRGFGGVGGGGGGGNAPEESAVLVVCQKENTTPMPVTEPATAATKNADDAVTPQFKRIQQRKEEWELRAQAARKALP